MDSAHYTLGLNTTYHELSACLLKDGDLVTAVEEERFNRIKHGKPALIDNPDVLPIKAIEYCLETAGIGFADIGHVAFSFCPKDRLQNQGVDKHFIEGDWGSKSGEELFHSKLMTLPDRISDLAGFDLKEKVIWVPHHISHAGSGYYVSPFSESAVLSIDGIGEVTSTWMGSGLDNKMGVIKEIGYPNSVGFLWEKFSKFLGFTEYDAQKLMGLASYGDPQKFLPAFKKIVMIGADGEFELDNDIIRFRADDYGPLEELFGIKALINPEDRTKDHEDLAASLQAITDEVTLNLVKFLSEKTKSRNLCMAGGVALNCVSNYAIMKSGLFDNIYIQPAANDAGTALGAAYHVWNDQMNKPREFVMDNAYWGPEFSNAEVEKALRTEGLEYKKVENIEEIVAGLIADGNIIGWFQGKMEWGPRALGDRSLIVDPRNGDMREVLNVRIKRRELFRPFAPSVLEEDAREWFEMPEDCQSISTEFMEFTFPVQKSKIGQIPAVTHIDDTSRIQVVKRETNPRYHKLITEFKKLTGVPMVLNTSFNDNEPIVCSPAEAINTFQRTKMDYLAIQDFLVARKDQTSTL